MFPLSDVYRIIMAYTTKAGVDVATATSIELNNMNGLKQLGDSEMSDGGVVKSQTDDIDGNHMHRLGKKQEFQVQCDEWSAMNVG